ncbi:hypothetical protein AB1283_21255 [Bacillus sp. S13(2024)]|uniref:hypothetical protein n=1 Tax=unclassified Bacillus (in: firmicutes) TaxID=185979 RepID=UPI003D23BBBE
MNSWVITAVIFFGVIYILDHINQINKRVKRTENQLEQIAKQLGVPEYVSNEEICQLVKDGNKIRAIKKAQKDLGLSLRESKDYIDSL